MKPLTKTLLRLGAAVLPTLTLVAVPSYALADEVHRYDDGTMETSVHVDSADGRDDTWVEFPPFPAGTANGTVSATLWLYGRAAECEIAGGPHWVLVGSAHPPVAAFDPCEVFPTTTFGWYSIAVPPTSLRETQMTRVTIYDSDVPPYHYPWTVQEPAPTGHNAHYGIDTSSDVHSRATLADATGTYDVAGELMWYLVLSGTKPSMSITTTSIAFGTHDPGTTVSRTVIVRSNGLENLHPGVTLTGSRPEDYTLANDSCSGRAIPPGSTCTFDVVHSRPTAGTSRAEVVVSAPDAGSHTISLYGEITAPAPVSAFTTADGATLMPDDPVLGSVTSTAMLNLEYVRFDPDLPGLATTTNAATLACDADRTSCTWSIDPLLAPGTYTVTAFGVDSQGNVEAPGPSIEVTVV